MSEMQENQKSSDPKQVFIKLRNLMLQRRRTEISLAVCKPSEPRGRSYGLGVRNGTATIAALSDGSASIYLSSAGGYISGRGIEPVRAAAQAAVQSARRVEIKRQPLTTFPLPEEHGVFFYLLTDTGVFVFQANEQELRSSNHPLKELGGAMYGIITQYRLRYPRPISVSE